MTENNTTERKKLFAGDRRRMAIYALAGVVVMLSSVFAGLLINSNNDTSRQVASLTPRNLDIWAVNPDGTVRFVTLIEPNAETEIPPQVDAAGPLVFDSEDVIRARILGGDPAGADFLSGAQYYGSEEDPIYYPLYWIEYGGTGTYGIDILVENSPYVAPDPDDPTGETQVITLGTNLEEGYQQVIVAIALPKDAQIVDMDGIYPYRQADIGDWQVLYYDTTAPGYGGTIYVRFIMPDEGDYREFNPDRVDDKR